VWQQSPIREIAAYAASPAMAFSSTGEKLVAANYRSISVFNSKTGKREQDHMVSTKKAGKDEYPIDVASLDVAPDGTVFAAGYAMFKDMASESHGDTHWVNLFSLNNRTVNRLLAPDDKALMFCSRTVKFVPHQPILAIGGSWTKELWLTEIDDYTKTKKVALPEDLYANQIVFSTDGRYMAVGGATGSKGNNISRISLHDVRNGALIQTLTGQFERFSHAFSSDGRYLVVAGREPPTSKVQVIDWRSGSIVASFSLEAAKDLNLVLTSRGMLLSVVSAIQSSPPSRRSKQPEYSVIEVWRLD
jgi:WD40 repeat protein